MEYIKENEKVWDERSEDNDTSLKIILGLS